MQREVIMDVCLIQGVRALRAIFVLTLTLIRDFPDHATFREKSVTTGLVGQAWGFPLFDSM